MSHHKSLDLLTPSPVPGILHESLFLFLRAQNQLTKKYQQELVFNFNE